MSKNVVLEINQITKRYGNKLALYSFSLAVEQGQIIALCGGNGAGKSTLIKIIAGIIPTTTGCIRLNGIEFQTDRQRYSRQIGYMPDDFQIVTLLTVKEWLMFYAALKNVTSQEVDLALQSVGLQEMKNEKCSHLSKGMRQRLMFAQANLAKPAVMLLDEPTNGLDPYWMDYFSRIIKKVREEQQTVIFSTHQMDIAAEVADRIMFMQEGKVLKEFSKEDFEINKKCLWNINEL